MTANVAQVRAKVQDYLTQMFSNISLGREGMLSLRHGSARCFVEVRAHDSSDWCWVKLTVPLLTGLKASPELNEWVAYNGGNFIFGHPYLDVWEDGITLIVEHNLLGDYLDQEELARAVGALLGSADRLDDELQSKFGGERYHED